MAVKYNYFDISHIDRNEWEQACPENEWRVTEAGILTRTLPDALLDKTHEVFLVSSGSTGGTLYYMANLLRIDEKANAVDEMPFGLVFVGQEAYGSGILVQHADHPGRTTQLQGGYMTNLQQSPIWQYHPFENLPSGLNGSLADLQHSNQLTAAQRLFQRIQEDFPIIV